ncbi:MAG: hypothetical protein OIF58_16430, partial [Cohaesibacter sp.]|nr:hypothetical protein [Cohaesibacter sp.]
MSLFGFYVLYRGLAWFLGGVWARLIVLWFVGGHLAESTILPLELYFEHRNYLPLLAGGLLLVALLNKLGQRRPYILALGCYGVVLILIAKANVSVWSNEGLMGGVWAKQSPSSPRAQQYLLADMAARGEAAEADALLQRVLASRPNDIHLNFQSVYLDCMLGRRVDLDKYIAAFEDGAKSKGALTAIIQLRRFVMNGSCKGLDLDGVNKIIATLLDHRSYKGGKDQSRFHQELAVGALIVQDFDRAIHHLDRAIENDPQDILPPLNKVVLLANAG